MQISRRDALRGATAAAVVTGAVTAPLAFKAAATKAALAGDPAVALAEELNSIRAAWSLAEDAFEDAAVHAGISTLATQGRCRDLGIESVWQEHEHCKNRFWDLRERLLDTPAATTRGVLAKFRAFYHDAEIADMRAGGDPDGDLPQEFAASVYRDLERLIGEASS